MDDFGVKSAILWFVSGNRGPVRVCGSQFLNQFVFGIFEMWNIGRPSPVTRTQGKITEASFKFRGWSQATQIQGKVKGNLEGKPKRSQDAGEPDAKAQASGKAEATANRQPKEPRNTPENKGKQDKKRFAAQRPQQPAPQKSPDQRSFVN